MKPPVKNIVIPRYNPKVRHRELLIAAFVTRVGCGFNYISLCVGLKSGHNALADANTRSGSESERAEIKSRAPELWPRALYCWL